MAMVLITDTAGTPRDWSDLETAVCYYALDKVKWEIGSKIHEFRGGINRHGEISTIAVSSIIGVSGPLFTKKYQSNSPYFERSLLYSRDHQICAYCGDEFEWKALTIDHIMPKSRGGKNIWTNCVTACRPCNHRKGSRTPEEAGLKLLYVPYVPNVFEKMILKNRRILADQMDFLKARVSKDSRIFR